ncbi:tyrosine-type recombinase/integrase [Vibrio mediterranei]
MPRIHLTQRFVDQAKPTATTQEYYDTAIRNLYLRVYPSGNRVFYVRVQYQGLRNNIKLGSANYYSLREIKALAKDRIHQEQTIVEEAYPSMTLGDFSEEFFVHYAYKVKPNTLKNYQDVYRIHIALVFQDREVLSFEREDIEQWFDRLSHVKTMANYGLVLFSIMMQRCEAWGYRKKNTNPCRNFTRYKQDNVERYLTHEELRRLWSVLNDLEQENPNFTLMIRLLIYTGCRSSEIRTLRWTEYRGGHLHLSDSKTGAKTVYLCQQVRYYLDHWSSDSGYVFPASDRSKPLGKQRLTLFWGRVRQLAKLDGVRLHDLRHTYASIAIQSKVSLTVVGRLLGHADPETTLKYAHLGSDNISKAASNVSGVLLRGMQT